MMVMKPPGVAENLIRLLAIIMIEIIPYQFKCAGRIMDQLYYGTIEKLEQMNVEREYILGWIGGYMNNPEREEQRVTEAYTAGYADGENKETTNAEHWLKS